MLQYFTFPCKVPHEFDNKRQEVEKEGILLYLSYSPLCPHHLASCQHVTCERGETQNKYLSGNNQSQSQRCDLCYAKE